MLTIQQPAEMATKDEDKAAVTLKTSELKAHMMDWSVDDMHKEFRVLHLKLLLKCSKKLGLCRITNSICLSCNNNNEIVTQAGKRSCIEHLFWVDLPLDLSSMSFHNRKIVTLLGKRSFVCSSSWGGSIIFTCADHPVGLFVLCSNWELSSLYFRRYCRNCLSFRALKM